MWPHMEGEDTFAQFKPRDYLNEYYTHIGSENEFPLRNLAKFYKKLDKKDGGYSIIELGGGPTIYQLISAAPIASEIHFTDYVDANLDEVRLWLQNDPRAFNWDDFIRTALTLETSERPTNQDILERRELLRQKITRVGFCDAFADQPLGQQDIAYDIVSVHYVPEGITSTIEEWQSVMANICSLAPNTGNHFVMSGVFEAEYWKSGKETLPAVSVNKEDIFHCLTTGGFEVRNFQLMDAENKKGEPTYQGFEAIFFVEAVKK